MIFYSFTHCMLRSIQQGIQSGHAAADILVKYRHDTSDAGNLTYDWAENHKTVVCLNGGNSADLAALYAFMDRGDNPYPWVAFREDEQSLDGVMTSIGIVLPPRIYETAATVRNNRRRTPAPCEPAISLRTNDHPEHPISVYPYVTRITGDIVTYVYLSRWEEAMIGALTSAKLAS